MTEGDLTALTLCDLPCFVLRNSPVNGGHFCGYVVLPPGHPWRNMSYDDIDVDVHGGLTFSGTLTDDSGVKHRVVGFDCAHWGDGPVTWRPRAPLRMWDAESVALECAKLADQVRKTTPPTRRRRGS